MRNLAAIDIGTNSFHLIVVKVFESGNFEIIDREKEVIRLGEGSTGDIKLITPGAIDRAVDTLKKFKGIADSHNADVRAVSTSAVREAGNKNEFIERVFNETGIDVEVISGNEEARLIYLGLLKAVPIYDEKILSIDIGGGSTEFLIGQNGNIFHSVSLKIGAVRLSQRFFPNYEITKSKINDCRKWVEGVIYHISHEVKELGFEVCVGSSGTIMSAGLMILSKRKKEVKPTTILNNFEFTQDELFEIEKDILKRKTIQERKKISGLDNKRIDIIPAGIILLSAICEQCDIDKITISGYALREGIIIDTIQKCELEFTKPKLHNIRFESIQQLAESCNFDKEHCSHSAKLSLQLFDQLKDLHGLDNTSKEYLEAAAVLHDIGYHISHNQHHHHSYYIIANCNLLGFNENEKNIIANVARYHRKSHPKERHKEYMSLPKRNQETVRKLSAILRVADSFDRTHSQNIYEIDSQVRNKKVELNLKYRCEFPDIELWSFDRRKELFEEVFDKKIVVASTSKMN